MKYAAPVDRVGTRERRAQLARQREFARNVLEATVLAAVHEITPGPSLLRTFVALEKATGDLTKPATRLAQTIDRERARIARERLTLPKVPATVNVATTSEPDPDIMHTSKRPRRTARAGRTIHPHDRDNAAPFPS